MIATSAPVGSCSTPKRPTPGMSSGPTQIVAPSFLARAIVASALSTATYGNQYGSTPPARWFRGDLVEPRSFLEQQRLDVVQHDLRLQERGRVDLPDRAAPIDEEDLEHVGKRAGRGGGGVGWHPHVLAEAVEKRPELTVRARGQEVPGQPDLVRRVAAAVGTHDRGRVVVRVEAEAHEAEQVAPSAPLVDASLQRLEHVRREWAAPPVAAPRVDEAQDGDPAGREPGKALRFAFAVEDRSFRRAEDVLQLVGAWRRRHEVELLSTVLRPRVGPREQQAREHQDFLPHPRTPSALDGVVERHLQ